MTAVVEVIEGALQVRLPGVPASVREARALVREALNGNPAEDAAEVCVSELVTNAIAHTRSGEPGGAVTVTVQPGPGWAVIRVTDAGAVRAPVLAGGPPATTEHGRGLRIIGALAAEWGTEGDAAGRVVWCLVRGGL